MRCLLAIVILALMAFAPTYAQTPVTCPTADGAPCVLKVGQSYMVSFDHPGTDTTGFRVYLRSGSGARELLQSQRQEWPDDVQIGPDILVAALQNGSATVTGVAPSAAGSYTLSVSAFNAAGESAKASLAFTVEQNVPRVPSNLRITILATIATDGRVEFKVVGIEDVGAK